MRLHDMTFINAFSPKGVRKCSGGVFSEARLLVEPCFALLKFAGRAVDGGCMALSASAVSIIFLRLLEATRNLSVREAKGKKKRIGPEIR